MTKKAPTPRMMKKNRAKKRAITIFLPFRLLCFAAAGSLPEASNGAASLSSTRDGGSAAAAALVSLGVLVEGHTDSGNSRVGCCCCHHQKTSHVTGAPLFLKRQRGAPV